MCSNRPTCSATPQTPHSWRFLSRYWLRQQCLDEGPGRRTPPLSGASSEGDDPPVPADQEGGREANHAIRGGDLTMRIHDERKGEAQFLRVLGDGPCAFAHVDSQ